MHREGGHSGESRVRGATGRNGQDGGAAAAMGEIREGQTGGNTVMLSHSFRRRPRPPADATDPLPQWPSERNNKITKQLALPCACSHSHFTLTALPLPFARISSHAAAAERERDGASERREEGGRRPSISARVMNSERDRQTEVAAATEAVAKMGMSMDADDGATSDLENRNEKQRRDRRDQHGFFLPTAGFCKGVH